LIVKPTPKPHRFLYYWLPALLYAGLIFALSSIRSPYLPHYPFHEFDKVVHFTEYAILALLWFRAMALGSGLDRKLTLLLALLVTGFLGAMDEWYQSFIPTRDSNVFDLAADLIGGLAALTLILLWMNIRRRRT
jgi:VanZ family protein